MKSKTTATKNAERPYVGQKCSVHGQECEIFAVHSMGTIDVVTLDGTKAWRVSGLSFTDSEELPAFNNK